MTSTPGLCRNCAQPVPGWSKGEHEVCSVYCCVQLNAPIDGLSDREIVQCYVEELTEATHGSDPEELMILQRGLARLLYWLTEADATPGRRELAGALKRFLAA